MLQTFWFWSVWGLGHGSLKFRVVAFKAFKVQGLGLRAFPLFRDWHVLPCHMGLELVLFQLQGSELGSTLRLQS